MKDIITDNYKLLHGDYLERMKEIPDGSVDAGVACLNTNRKFIGIELDDNYFDIGAERMRNHIKNE